MNGLKKISSIVLLAFLPLMVFATTPEVIDLPAQVVEVTEVPDAEATPVHMPNQSEEPAATVAMPVVGIESVIEPPIAEPLPVAPTLPETLLEKAKRENAARANMRRAALTDTECLAIAMYHEARGEGDIGMKAVAYVIYNRKKDGRFATTICDVVLQKSQFSFVTDRIPDNINSWGVFARALEMSVHLLDNNGFETEKSPVGNALFFNSLATNRKWVYASGRKFIATIGNHHFFK